MMSVVLCEVGVLTAVLVVEWRVLGGAFLELWLLCIFVRCVLVSIHMIIITCHVFL